MKALSTLFIIVNTIKTISLSMISYFLLHKKKEFIHNWLLIKALSDLFIIAHDIFYFKKCYIELDNIQRLSST